MFKKQRIKVVAFFIAQVFMLCGLSQAQEAIVQKNCLAPFLQIKSGQLQSYFVYKHIFSLGQENEYILRTNESKSFFESLNANYEAIAEWLKEEYEFLDKNGQEKKYVLKDYIDLVLSGQFEFPEKHHDLISAIAFLSNEELWEQWVLVRDEGTLSSFNSFPALLSFFDYLPANFAHYISYVNLMELIDNNNVFYRKQKYIFLEVIKRWARKKTADNNRAEQIKIAQELEKVLYNLLELMKKPPVPLVTGLNDGYSHNRNPNERIYRFRIFQDYCKQLLQLLENISKPSPVLKNTTHLLIEKLRAISVITDETIFEKSAKKGNYLGNACGEQYQGAAYEQTMLKAFKDIKSNFVLMAIIIGLVKADNVIDSSMISNPEQIKAAESLIEATETKVLLSTIKKLITLGQEYFASDNNRIMTIDMLLQTHVARLLELVDKNSSLFLEAEIWRLKEIAENSGVTIYNKMHFFKLLKQHIGQIKDSHQIVNNEIETSI
ncbi:MAG: hypothetical protein ABIG64_07340 [Candidatus Omnitrophota bacterium]